jgi:LAO/AO transport system kinase
MWSQLLQQIQQHHFKALARCISLVENEATGYYDFLAQLPSAKSTSIIGITGAPGAGKSTLTDALIDALVADNKRVGILCVDPSSPFNLGALLGDRIRMSNWYNHPNVFIRSLATRGSLGGLHPHIIEIMSVMQAAGFDYIIVETVGVGQSEIEIAGLADTTVVVVVPESGDEVQTMKAGLMEIADIFVVNKSDRPDADNFVHNLRQLLAPTYHNASWQAPIIKTTASQKKGIDELVNAIQQHLQQVILSDKKYWLLAERAYQIIQQQRMKDMSKQALKNAIIAAHVDGGFNLFNFINNLNTTTAL